jgi:hypothetical protein
MSSQQQQAAATALKYPKPKSNMWTGWTDNDFIRRMVLSSPKRSEDRIVTETFRLRREISDLILLISDVDANHDLGERQIETALTFLRKAKELIQDAEDEVVEELAVKQGR